MNICVKLLGLYATTGILVHLHRTENVKLGAAQQIPSVKKVIQAHQHLKTRQNYCRCQNVLKLYILSYYRRNATEGKLTWSVRKATH